MSPGSCFRLLLHAKHNDRAHGHKPAVPAVRPSDTLFVARKGQLQQP